MSGNTSDLSVPRPREATDPAAVRLRAEIVRHLPVWFYFFYGVLLLNTALTNFSPPRPDLAWTVAFPLGVFVLFYAAQAVAAPGVTGRLSLALLAFGLAVGTPLLILAIHRPSPLTGHGLLLVYEWSNFLWAGLMLWHAWRARGRHASLFFGAGLLYGALLENGGIVLGFFHETNLTSTIVPPMVAPFATMLGWCVVLYMGTYVAWHLRGLFPALRRSPALSGLLVAALATALDLQIDPMATAAGAWVWHQSLPPWFHGVPRVNFVAWMCAIFPFAWAVFRHQERAGIEDGGAWSRRDVWAMTKAVPGTLAIAAMCFLVTTALLEGGDGPSWTLLYAFAVKALRAAGL